MRRSGKLCASRSSQSTLSFPVRFFEQQDEARARTRQLLLLLVLAVALLVLAINAALNLRWRLVTPGFSKYPAYFFVVNTVMTLAAWCSAAGGWKLPACTAVVKSWHGAWAHDRPGRPRDQGALV